MDNEEIKDQLDGIKEALWDIAHSISMVRWMFYMLIGGLILVGIIDFIKGCFR